MKLLKKALGSIAAALGLFPSLATAQTGYAWEEVALSGRYSHAAAFDGVGVITFGGASAPGLQQDLGADELNSQTWGLYGASDGAWHRLTDPVSVAYSTDMEQESHCMASAGEYGVLLFTSRTIQDSDRAATTWLWTPSGIGRGTWNQIGNARSRHPSQRDNAAMAYDEDTRQIVLFGGFDGTSDLNDTWTFDVDAQKWFQATNVGTPPSVRYQHAMAYDPMGHRIVLFGGAQHVTNQAPTLLGDTWIWDGTQWSPLPTPAPVAETCDTGPSNAPGARRLHAMAGWTSSEQPEPAHGGILLFGGLAGDMRPAVLQGNSSTKNFADTWILSGSTWTPVADSRGMCRVGDQCACLVSTIHECLSLGFQHQPPLPANYFGPGTTSQDCGQNSYLYQRLLPQARKRHVMAFDANRHRVVMNGGEDFWESGSTAWVGGEGEYYSDTWEWNPDATDAGGNWAPRWEFRDESPEPRNNGSLAYDPANQVMVLVGGQVAQYSPGTWDQRITDNGPESDQSTWFQHANNEWFAGTMWEWDGSWHQYPPPGVRRAPQCPECMAGVTPPPGCNCDISSPGRVAFVGLAYDPEMHAVAMFGGWSQHLGDTGVATGLPTPFQLWDHVSQTWSTPQSTACVTPNGYCPGSSTDTPLTPTMLYCDTQLNAPVGRIALYWPEPNGSPTAWVWQSGWEPGTGYHRWEAVLLNCDTVDPIHCHLPGTWDNGMKGAYDTDRHQLILSGGDYGTVIYCHPPPNEIDYPALVQLLKDGCWTTLATNTGDAYNAWGGVVYDNQRHQLLMFGGGDSRGGSNAGQQLNSWAPDLPSGDNVPWNPESVSTVKPSPRMQFAMAQNTGSGTTLLFGGQRLGANGRMLGDTWQLRPAPSCPCSADFNCDGAVGTDADIAAFFACLSGNCPVPPCPSNADFNCDGAVGTDADIEAFFRVLSGETCD